MTAMGIAMVVAVFVMTHGDRAGLPRRAGRERLERERDPAAQGRDLGDRQRGAAAAAADDRGAAAGRARRDGHPLASPELVVIISLPRVVGRQAGQRAAARRRPAGVRDPQHADIRRGPPLHAGHARDQRRQAGDRPLQGADARQRRQVRRHDLEGRRRLHRRRCVVRVGGLGRRRPDDAGVSAQRLSVDDGEADRSVGVRIVRGGDRRRSAARSEGLSASATTTKGSRRRPAR